MKKIFERSISNIPPFFILLYICIALTPLFRFTWDISFQIFFHILIYASFALLLIKYRPAFRISDLLSLAFLFAAVATIFGSADKATVRNSLLVLLDGLFLAYIASFLTAEEKSHLFQIPVFVAFFYSIILIFFSLKHPDDIFFSKYSEILLNPNIIAGYLLLSFPFALYYYKKNTNNTERYASAVLIFFVLAGIFITKSRTATFIACAILLFQFLSSRTEKTPFGFKFLASAAFAAVIAFITFLKWGFNFTDRISWFKTSLDIFLHNPFMGVGWGNYENYALFFNSGSSLNSAYAHNLIAQMLAESGLITFAFFTLMIAFWFITGFKALKYNGSENSFIKYSLIAGSGFLLFNLFDYGFYIPANYFLFMAAMGSLTPFIKPRASKGSKFLIISIAIIGFAYIFWLSGIFIANICFQRSFYYEKNGNIVLAKNEISKAISCDPLPSKYLNKSANIYWQEYLKTKEPETILRSIDLKLKAISKNPLNARYWYELSLVYQLINSDEKALQAISYAVQYDKENKTYKNLYSSFLQKSGTKSH